jgi:hypothetical protein
MFPVKKSTKPRQKKLEAFGTTNEADDSDPNCWKEYRGAAPCKPQGQSFVLSLEQLSGNALMSMYANWIKGPFGYPEINVQHQIAEGNIKVLSPLEVLPEHYLQYFHKDVDFEPWLGKIKEPKDIPFNPADKHRRPLFDYRYYLEKMEARGTPMSEKQKAQKPKKKKSQRLTSSKGAEQPPVDLAKKPDVSEAAVKFFNMKDHFKAEDIEEDERYVRDFSLDTIATDSLEECFLESTDIQTLINHQERDLLVCDDLKSIDEILGVSRQNQPTNEKQNSPTKNKVSKPKETKKPVPKKQPSPAVPVQKSHPPSPVKPTPSPKPPKVEAVKQDKTIHEKPKEETMKKTKTNPPQKDIKKSTKKSQAPQQGKQKRTSKQILEKQQLDDYLDKNKIFLTPQLPAIAKLLDYFDPLKPLTKENLKELIQAKPTMEGLQNLYIKETDNEIVLVLCWMIFRVLLPSEDRTKPTRCKVPGEPQRIITYHPQTNIMTVSVETDTHLFKIDWEFVNALFVALCGDATTSVLPTLLATLEGIGEIGKQINIEEWFEKESTQKVFHDFMMTAFKYLPDSNDTQSQD